MTKQRKRKGRLLDTARNAINNQSPLIPTQCVGKVNPLVYYFRLIDEGKSKEEAEKITGIRSIF